MKEVLGCHIIGGRRLPHNFAEVGGVVGGRKGSMHEILEKESCSNSININNVCRMSQDQLSIDKDWGNINFRNMIWE